MPIVFTNMATRKLHLDAVKGIVSMSKPANIAKEIRIVKKSYMTMDTSRTRH